MAETDDSNVLSSETIFLILLTIFAAGVLYFIWNSSNSAYIWEDYYAKQTATFLNSAKNGEEVIFDIQPIIKIAKSNGLDISNPENFIRINANNNEVCVKLSKSAGTCYPYFNEVAVRDIKTIPNEDSLSFSFIVEEKNGGSNG